MSSIAFERKGEADFAEAGYSAPACLLTPDNPPVESGPNSSLAVLKVLLTTP